MTKTPYIAVCAVAAVGLSFASPKAASAFPAAPGADKTYTQTVAGGTSIPVYWRGGRGWGHRGVGWRGGYYGGWRGVGWRRGWGGYGWGWPVGVGLGLGAASTYPYYGGYYSSGYYPGYYGDSCGW